MSGGIGGMGAGPSDELLGILYDNGAFKDVEMGKDDDSQSDRQRMLAYGKSQKIEGFFHKLFHKKA